MMWAHYCWAHVLHHNTFDLTFAVAEDLHVISPLWKLTAHYNFTVYNTKRLLLMLRSVYFVLIIPVFFCSTISLDFDLKYGSQRQQWWEKALLETTWWRNIQKNQTHKGTHRLDDGILDITHKISVHLRILQGLAWILTSTVFECILKVSKPWNRLNKNSSSLVDCSGKWEVTGGSCWLCVIAFSCFWSDMGSCTFL